MKLFHAAASPFVRKVVVQLIETGQMDDVELVAAYGTVLDPGSMPVSENPAGRLPTLVRDDGMALYDSRVITRYLDDRAGAGLYPPAPKLWDTLVVEATAEGILESALQIVYEARLRSEEMRTEAIVDGHWAKIARSLSVLSSRWMAHLNGPLDMGQIAVGCALGYLDFRIGDRDWRAANPELAGWFETFSQRESMLRTVPQHPK